jgi:hypothetical protein
VPPRLKKSWYNRCKNHTGKREVARVLTQTTSGGTIIQQRDPGNFNGEYVLQVTGGKVGWSTYGNGQYGLNFVSTRSVNDGAWHFVVGVRQADGTGQIYIDGLLNSSQAASAVPLGSGFRVYLGEDVRDAVDLGPAYADNFVGEIDEAQSYGTSLISTQILALAANVGPIDQSGYGRGAGSGIDIGAVEFGVAQVKQPVFVTQPASVTAGQSFGTLQVRLLDAFGQVLTTDNSDQVTLTGAPFAPGSTASVTVQNGVATFSNLVIGQAGTYTLTASVAGLPSLTSNAFTVAPEAASTFVMAGFPSATTGEWPAP